MAVMHELVRASDGSEAECIASEIESGQMLSCSFGFRVYSFKA